MSLLRMWAEDWWDALRGKVPQTQLMPHYVSYLWCKLTKHHPAKFGRLSMCSRCRVFVWIEKE